VFAKFDHDGNDSIDTSELGNALRFLGCNPLDSEVEAMIAEADGKCKSACPTSFHSFLYHLARIALIKSYDGIFTLFTCRDEPACLTSRSEVILFSSKVIVWAVVSGPRALLHSPRLLYIALCTRMLFMVALCNRADHYIFAL